MSTKNIKTNKTSQTVQVNWLLMQLQQGKQREDFISEFIRMYKLSQPTFDKRLKVARQQYELILEANQKENEQKLKKDPEWEKTHANLLESKKLIYDTIGYLIINKRKKVKVNGVEKTVLDFSLDDARNLKTIWEMNLIGLGEPTSYVKNDNNNLNTDIQITKTIKNEPSNQS